MRITIIICFLLVFFNSNSQEIMNDEIIGDWSLISIKIIHPTICTTNPGSLDISGVYYEFYSSGEFSIIFEKTSYSGRKETFGLWELRDEHELTIKIEDGEQIFKFWFKEEKLYLSSKLAQLAFKRGD